MPPSLLHESPIKVGFHLCTDFMIVVELEEQTVSFKVLPSLLAQSKQSAWHKASSGEEGGAWLCIAFVHKHINTRAPCNESQKILVTAGV